VSLAHSLDDLHEIELQGKGVLSDKVLDLLAQYVGPTLRRVQLSRIARISDRGLERLVTSACKLEHLRIRSCRTDEALFERVAASRFENPSLTHFEFRGFTPLSFDVVVAMTVVFPNLQCLEVTIERTKPANLPIGITGLARLHTLRVEYLATDEVDDTEMDTEMDWEIIRADLQRLFATMPSLVCVEWNKLLVERRIE